MYEYHLALGSGVDMITDVASDAVNISHGWNEFWDSTYRRDNGLWLAAIDLSTFVTSCSFLAWTISFYKSLFSNKWSVAFEEYLWIIIVIMLLHNNGEMAVQVVKAMRYIAVDKTEVIYDMVLRDVSIKEALTDALISSSVQDQIRVEMRDCEVKTGKEQISCIEGVSKLARNKIFEAERKYGKLAGLKRLGQRITNYMLKINDPNHQGSINLTPGSLMLGSATQGVVHYILKLFQLAFAHLFELSLAVTGLYAPIAIALSTLPMPTRFLWWWLQKYLSVAVALWSYAIIVGVVAWVTVLSETQTYTDSVFLLLIGFCAPLLAWGLALGGGTAIWNSVTSGLTTAFRILF